MESEYFLQHKLHKWINVPPNSGFDTLEDLEEYHNIKTAPLNANERIIRKTIEIEAISNGE